MTKNALKLLRKITEDTPNQTFTAEIVSELLDKIDTLKSPLLYIVQLECNHEVDDCDCAYMMWKVAKRVLESE